MSTGREQVKRLLITVSSGSGTGTITNEWSLCRWVRVKPVSETDSFDLTIRDADNDIIIKRTGQVGTFSENLQLSLGIVRSFLIENATQDGNYTLKLDCH